MTGPSTAFEPAPAGRRRRRISALLLIGLLAGLALAARKLPLAPALLELVEWVRDSGPGGIVVFVLAYVAASVALVPASLLTLAAGFLWGPLLGAAVVAPSATLGATAAFLIGRGFGRGWVERRLGTSPRLAALDRAVGEQGLRLVALLRLSPAIPFVLLNYALSLTRVRLGDYVLGSFLGMLPLTVVYVYLGSIAGDLARLASGQAVGGTARWAVLGGGLAATAVVAVVITRRARRVLAAALPAAAGGGSGR